MWSIVLRFCDGCCYIFGRFVWIPPRRKQRSVKYFLTEGEWKIGRKVSSLDLSIFSKLSYYSSCWKNSFDYHKSQQAFLTSPEAFVSGEFL